MKKRKPKKDSTPKDSFSDQRLKDFIENEFGDIGEVMIPLGLAEAFVGFSTSERDHPCLVYDANKIIEILVKRDEMTREEAVEFFEYNIECVKSAEGNHPLYIWSLQVDWNKN
jgi:hypothetical protein